MLTPPLRRVGEWARLGVGGSNFHLWLQNPLSVESFFHCLRRKYCILDLCVCSLLCPIFPFIVSSVQFALGLPTLLLSCVHFLNLLLSNDTLCIDVFSWLSILTALLYFSLLYASTNDLTLFFLPSSTIIVFTLLNIEAFELTLFIYVVSILNIFLSTFN